MEVKKIFICGSNRFDHAIAFRIFLQASVIWFSETINGGEIRKQFGANKNQSVIIPF